MTLEELLNNLIERGWKPFGNKKIKDAKTARWNKNLLNEEVNKVSKFKDKIAFTNGVLIFDEINLRELVSKESGLRQFVCENGMIKNANDYSWELYNGGHGQYEVYKNGYEGGKRWEQVDYEYRIIESALKDEEDLEKFLLDNIKIS